MRCDDCQNRLLELAYDELNVAEAAQCRKHLAECPLCRSEWAALCGTQALLDRVSKHQAEVDVTAVCLRSLAAGRCSSMRWRWLASLAAVAAVVVFAAALRWLSVDVQPGRLVLAWREGPQVVAPAAEPGSGVEKARPAAAAAAPSIASASRQAPRSMLSDASTVAMVLESDGLRDWAPRQELWQLREGHASVDDATFARPAANGRDASAPASSYADLRRQLIEDRPRSTVRGSRQGG